MKLRALFTGSFHSAAAYRHIRKAANFGMGYALVLVTLTSLFVTVCYAQFIHRTVFVAHAGQPALLDSVVTQVAGQVPVMTLKGDTLMTKEPIATEIKISGTAFGESFENLVIATIDTTGQSTHANMHTPVLITATEMIIQSDKETKIKKLSEFTKNGPETILINRAVAEDMAKNFLGFVHANLIKLYLIIGAIVWFFLIVFTFILRIFMLLALGLMGLLIGSLTKQSIPFAALVGLASLSYTPVALLDIALLIGFGYAPHVLTLFLAGTVTLFAAMKCSDESTTSPAPTA